MEFKFAFSEQEAQIILNALTKETYATVVDVINSIQTQAKIQIEEENKKTETIEG